MIHRTFRYRLDLTAEQANVFEQFAGVARLVYNLALEQRTTFHRQFRTATGLHLNYPAQGRELTKLRAEFDWIAAVPCTVLQQALRDLDASFSSFFAGRTGYPTPRRKGLNDSFRFVGRDTEIRRLNARWSAAWIQKVGWVKFRDSRPLQGKLLCLTVTKRDNGWFACFACQIEHEAPANRLPSVGIDRGIANTLALSTGEMISLPSLKAMDRRKKRAQRVLARRVRGSQRHGKQKALVRRLSAKVARCRADWRHKVTIEIARRFGSVAIEALKIANMTRSGTGKRGLNRSILEQGWGAFERVLSYKLEERGGTLIKVNPAHTSQTCSACGAVDKASRESQASFACRHCGFATHADTNAALNILRRSTPRVEGCGYAPDEARTINLAA